MKYIVTVTGSRIQEVEATSGNTARTLHKCRVQGVDAAGTVHPFVLWGSDALAIDKQMSALIPEGVEMRDVGLVVEFEGIYQERTFTAPGRGPRVDRFVKVQANGFKILSGPAQELHRARTSAAAALVSAEKLAQSGDYQAAYMALASHVAAFSPHEQVAEAPSPPDTQPDAPEAATSQDQPVRAPEAAPEVTGAAVGTTPVSTVVAAGGAEPDTAAEVATEKDNAVVEPVPTVPEAEAAPTQAEAAPVDDIQPTLVGKAEDVPVADIGDASGDRPVADASPEAKQDADPAVAAGHEAPGTPVQEAPSPVFTPTTETPVPEDAVSAPDPVPAAATPGTAAPTSPVSITFITRREDGASFDEDPISALPPECPEEAAARDMKIAVPEKTVDPTPGVVPGAPAATRFPPFASTVSKPGAVPAAPRPMPGAAQVPGRPPAPRPAPGMPQAPTRPQSAMPAGMPRALVTGMPRPAGTTATPAAQAPVARAPVPQASSVPAKPPAGMPLRSPPSALRPPAPSRMPAPPPPRGMGR